MFSHNIIHKLHPKAFRKGKQQMWICRTWTSFRLTCRFPVHYFYTNFSSFRIVLDGFFLLTFHFENFLTWIWLLPFAICLKRDSKYLCCLCNLWSSGRILFYPVSWWRVLIFYSHASFDKPINHWIYIFSCLKMNLSSETVMRCFLFENNFPLTTNIECVNITSESAIKKNKLREAYSWLLLWSHSPCTWLAPGIGWSFYFPIFFLIFGFPTNIFT